MVNLKDRFRAAGIPQAMARLATAEVDPVPDVRRQLLADVLCHIQAMGGSIGAMGHGVPATPQPVAFLPLDSF